MNQAKGFLRWPFAVLGLAFLASISSLGCPINSDQSGCYSSNDCPAGQQCTASGLCIGGLPYLGGTAGSNVDASAALDASADGSTKDAAGKDALVEAVATGDGAFPVYCGSPNDCAATETCATDGTCHPGDCSAIPCINQFECEVIKGASACVHGDSRACGTDQQCLTSERCIAGSCTAMADLCTDQTQCPSSRVCDQGKCTTACTSDPQCPAGYKCRIALGVCDVPAKACSVTSDCAAKDSVCVDGACVPRCGARGACGNGSGTCVDNGCVPDQKPAHQCDGAGTPAGCAAGQVCLHGHCYVSCESPNQTACASQATAPLCKTVKLGSTSYSICGTTQTLGSECDPSANLPCTGTKTCIDGFCR
jgi:hypothetical protein